MYYSEKTYLGPINTPLSPYSGVSLLFCGGFSGISVTVAILRQIIEETNS